MSPTFTCNVVRKLSKVLGEDRFIDPSARVSMKELPSEITLFRNGYLLNNLTRKMQASTDKERAVANAIASFIKREQSNHTTNARLRKGIGLTNDTILLLLRARKVIEIILGDLTEEIVVQSVFTGGASTSRRRDHSSVELKWIPTWDRLNCTTKALPFWRLAESQMYCRREAIDTGHMLDVSINETSRWSSVPKDSYPEPMERSIIIGNDANVFLQRGAGKTIRAKLLRFGIDLTDQSRNQELSRIASISGCLTTHDSRDASNCMVYQAVRLMLPPRWFAYLEAISERTCELPDGTLHDLELFSSMGNGFTFELQSLLFFAMAVAAGGASIENSVTRGVGVFGDDVIIPTEWYDRFLTIFTYLGFEVNSSKSFSTGPFRESCGAHWFEGVCVKPFFIREEFGVDPRPRYKFVNELRMWYYGNYDDNYNPGIESVIDDVLGSLNSWQVPLSMDPTTGVYSYHDAKHRITVVKNRRGIVELRFKAYLEKATRLTLKSDDELMWYLFSLWSKTDLEGRRFISRPGKAGLVTMRIPYAGNATPVRAPTGA